MFVPFWCTLRDALTRRWRNPKQKLRSPSFVLFGGSALHNCT
jgi:hypothetical protein